MSVLAPVQLERIPVVVICNVPETFLDISNLIWYILSDTVEFIITVHFAKSKNPVEANIAVPIPNQF